MVDFANPVSFNCHRFGERIAVFVGTGETVYLTPESARVLSRALNKTAREIEGGTRFVDSQVGTISHTQNTPKGNDK
jgi:hypothetical protein